MNHLVTKSNLRLSFSVILGRSERMSLRSEARNAVQESTFGPDLQKTRTIEARDNKVTCDALEYSLSLHSKNSRTS